MRRRAGNFTSAVSVLRPARSPLAAVASVIKYRTRFIWIVLLWGFSPPHLRHNNLRGNAKGRDDVDGNKLPLFTSSRCLIELRVPGDFRCETGEGHYQERKRDHGGQHPECEYRKLLQAWEQVGVVHEKGRPQDDIGPDHANDVDNDPLLPHHAPHHWFLPEASCGIASKSETIADRCQNEEVGVG